MEVAVASGVPQGSVLGPLLFIVYINSLASTLRCRWYSFADDFKIYLSSGSGMELVLQRDLDMIFEVSRSWNLKLNLGKCVVMRFGAGGRGVAEGMGSGCFLGGVELKLTLAHKDLGVFVDPTLKFHTHISSVVRKASGLANNILRCTVCREPSFMVSIFVAHIRPVMDYCSTVWNLGYAGDALRLESVQRRWTKQVAGMDRLSYSERLRVLGLYSVAGRLLRADLLKTWKIFHGGTPPMLLNIFERSFHGATRGHRFKLSIPRCRGDLRRRFFNVRMVGIWNEIPGWAVELPTQGKFKSYLDGNLLDKFYEVP